MKQTMIGYVKPNGSDIVGVGTRFNYRPSITIIYGVKR